MKYPATLLLMGLTIFSACKKNALPGAGGNTLNKTVATFSGNPSYTPVDSFVYDGQHRLAQIIINLGKFFGGDTVALQYDASGRVTSWTESIGGQGTYVRYELAYDGSGQLVRATALPLFSNFALSDYSFSYNTAGQVAADTVFAQHLAGAASDGVTNYGLFTYDKNGNVVTDQEFVSANSNFIGTPFKLVATNSYQYDTHVNPYYRLGIPYCAAFGIGPQLLSPNNVVGGTSTDPLVISPSKYSFSYYSNDRPRTQTTTVSGVSGMQTETFTYYYQ
jgi:hypothetical protein